jgi:hypothetical protein
LADFTPTPRRGTQKIPTTDPLKERSQELGLLGKLFGSREHAPINIAGAIMIAGVLGMLIAPFLPTSTGFSTGDMVKGLGALVLAAFTFLGGYLGGGKKD